MRLINADEIVYESIDSSDTIRHEHYFGTGILAVRKEDIDDMLTVEPEIILCRDCKHWTRTCGDKQWGLGDCDVFDKHMVMCDGYCAWAERREE